MSGEGKREKRIELKLVIVELVVVIVVVGL